MLAKSRWDLIRRLRVNICQKCFPNCHPRTSFGQLFHAQQDKMLFHSVMTLSVVHFILQKFKRKGYKRSWR